MHAMIACEFSDFEPDANWQSPPNFPTGMEEKVLGGVLDEVAKTGRRTRLVRFSAGTFTTQKFVHDYWEEVVLISGDLAMAIEDGIAPRVFNTINYACRPPGTVHGPFRSEGGCVVLEVHYYIPNTDDAA